MPAPQRQPRNGKTAPDASAFATAPARRRAVARRDGRADNFFVFAVKTTGIYCRPSCRARAARRENIVFFANAAEAERAGFRACKRCLPNGESRAARDGAIVAHACRAIETAIEKAHARAPSLHELAAKAGMSPYHFHRLFRRLAGVTPKEYEAALLQRRVQRHLGDGARVTEAIYAAGFNSSGRFYAAASSWLGMRPRRYAKGGAGETIRYGIGRCSLGRVLVAATPRGVCAVLLGDDAKSLAAELARRFSKATVVKSGAEFAGWISAAVSLVDDPARSADFALPLDIRGTAFQRLVWQALRKIPPGETTHYAALAEAIKMPRAARAVGAACATNPLAVVVPCHRVVAADGGLNGYRWGIERKRRLLARERKQ